MGASLCYAYATLFCFTRSSMLAVRFVCHQAQMKGAPCCHSRSLACANEPLSLVTLSNGTLCFAFLSFLFVSASELRNGRNIKNNQVIELRVGLSIFIQVCDCRLFCQIIELYMFIGLSNFPSPYHVTTVSVHRITMIVSMTKYRKDITSANIDLSGFFSVHFVDVAFAGTDQPRSGSRELAAPLPAERTRSSDSLRGTGSGYPYGTLLLCYWGGIRGGSIHMVPYAR